MIVIEKKLKNIHYFLLIGIVVFCDYVRIFLFKSILGGKYAKLGNINVFALIFTIYIIFIALRKGIINKFILWISIITNVFIFISIVFGSQESSMVDKITIWVNTILLISVLGIDISKVINIRLLMKSMLKIMNYLLIVIIIIGCIDYISNFKIQQILIKYFFLEGYFTEDIARNMNGFYRYYSIWGHPLRLGGMILNIFALNIVCIRYYGKIININFLAIICLIGASLVNSKTTIVGLVGLTLLMSFREKKGTLIKLLISLVILFIIFNTDFFRETIINRFINTDLTTGRNEIVKYMIDGYVEKPKWIGEGIGYSYYITGLTGLGALSFEYPPIMFSYDYGIVATIFIYISIFIYPVVRMIKSKQWLVLCCYGIVFLQYNTHAGIVVKEDAMIQLVFFTYLILNMLNDKCKIKKIIPN